MHCFMRLLAVIALSSGAVGVLGAEKRAHHTFRYLTDSGYPQIFKTMTFSPDSAQLAVSVAGKLDFIDVNLGRITGQYKAAPFSVTYTRDGGRVYMISTYQAVLLDTFDHGLELGRHVVKGPGQNCEFMAITDSDPLAQITPGNAIRGCHQLP